MSIEKEEKFDALTIDTCIFESQSLALEGSIRKHLLHFVHTPGSLVLSDVVVSELRGHLLEKTKEAKLASEKACKLASDYLRIAEADRKNALAILMGGRGPEEVVDDRVSTFMRDCGAGVICASNVSAKELMALYFESSPPFEEAGKKKNEFPDAVALLSIQKWAVENGLKVLAVSNDRGWKEFAQKSSHLSVVESLSDAVSHFHSVNTKNAAKSAINQIRVALGVEDSDLSSEVHDAIVDFLDGGRVSVDVSSRFHCDVDSVHLEYQDQEYSYEDSGDIEVNLISAEENSLTVNIPVRVSFEVKVSVAMYVWDSIDKETVPMGSSELTREIESDFDILIEFEGDYTAGLDELEVVSMEIYGKFPSVSFHDVDPDGWYD